MFDKLATEEQRYEELMRLLGTSEVQSDAAVYRKHAKALSELEPLIEKFREYKTVVHNVAETAKHAEHLFSLRSLRSPRLNVPLCLTSLRQKNSATKS